MKEWNSLLRIGATNFTPSATWHQSFRQLMMHTIVCCKGNQSHADHAQLAHRLLHCWVEQHGKDKAEYGTQLLKKLEERVNRKGLTTTLFKWARKFYRLYPQMTDNLPTCATVMHQFVTPGKTIISHLSFTHLREIMTLSAPLARYFYEQECIKCTWSVRELRRQITTLIYM